ncbi:MAG: hypothetical protein LBS85_06865 [Clostridiales Family XIII bacterium]|jgi:hypothetical protein|nr:hypothetical protein [Clostridiales Family XIII bacterium]
MKSGMRKSDHIISIVLFAIAGLLIAYAVWAIIKSHTYIAELVTAGQLVIKDSVYDVVSFYMSACAQYIVFAVLLFAGGWLLRSWSAAAVVGVGVGLPRGAAGEDDDDASLSGDGAAPVADGDGVGVGFDAGTVSAGDVGAEIAGKGSVSADEFADEEEAELDEWFEKMREE